MNHNSINIYSTNIFLRKVDFIRYLFFFLEKEKQNIPQKHFFRPFGLHFGLKIRVGAQAPLLNLPQGTRQVIPGGGEVTPLYRLYGYVRPKG